MTTMCMADLPATETETTFAILSAIKERCAALGMSGEQTRKCQRHGMSLYPQKSAAWCISQGVALAHQMHGGVSSPSPPSAA